MTQSTLNTLRTALAANQIHPDIADYPAMRTTAQQLAIRPWLTSRFILAGTNHPAAISDHHQDVMRAMAMTADLRWIAQVAEQTAAQVLVIKGAALMALGSTGNPWRHTEDIDIVAAPGVAHTLHRAMLARGARFADLGESVAVDGSDYRQQVTKDHHALFPLVAPMGTMVDIHRTLPSRIFTWARTARRSRRLWAATPALHVPEHSDHLTILADHALIKHRAHPAALARHIVDTRFLLDAGARIESASARASILLLSTLAEPSPFTSLAARAVVPDDAQYRFREWVDNAMEQGVRIRRDLRWRPRMLWYKLLPHPDYMRAHFGEARSSTERGRQHLDRWQQLLSRAGK